MELMIFIWIVKPLGDHYGGLSGIQEGRLGPGQRHERLAEQETNGPNQECLLINNNPVGLFHKSCVYNIPQHRGFERIDKTTNQTVSNKEIQSNVSCELAHKRPVLRTLQLIGVPED